jgi:hypothetical protein
MKTLKFLTLAILAALTIALVSCSKDELDTPFYTADNGVSKELTSLEKAGLLTLLEKQKMHRDVYNWIYAQFPSQVFSSLAKHDGALMERLSIKVDKYGLVNPVIDKLAGEFADASIQVQYNDFTRDASGDLEKMINGAKAMEAELIAEVAKERSILSGNPDIDQVYGELMLESQGHLNILNDEMKGLIHIYAPMNPIKDM